MQEDSFVGDDTLVVNAAWLLEVLKALEAVMRLCEELRTLGELHLPKDKS